MTITWTFHNFVFVRRTVVQHGTYYYHYFKIHVSCMNVTCGVVLHRNGNTMDRWNKDVLKTYLQPLNRMLVNLYELFHCPAMCNRLYNAANTTKDPFTAQFVLNRFLQP